MRFKALAAFVLGAGVAGSACAQSGTFARGAETVLNQAAFAPAGARSEFPSIDALIDRQARGPDAAAVRWRDRETVVGAAKDGSSVDSLRLSTAEVMVAPDGRPLNLTPATLDDRAYEVTLTRAWPSRWKYAGSRFDVDVSPHAGVGVGAFGSSAEAGAVVRVGHKLDDAVARRLADMGVRDGSSFGNEGRWYLFAAASGRAVGLNMLRGDSGWDRAGWSTDPAASIIADAHLGVGWRRGDMQTSLGLVHREVKGEHMIWGQETKGDSLVAFTFSIKPGR